MLRGRGGQRKPQWSTGLHQAGVTLIELIIAIALSLILGAVVYAVIVSQSRAYSAQDNMTRLQQNLRISMSFLSRYIAMAGYGTPGYTLVQLDQGVNGVLPAIRGYDGGTGEPDALQVVFVDPSRMVMTAFGFDQPCDTSSLTFQNSSDWTVFQDEAYMMCFDYSDSARMKSFVFKVTNIDQTSGLVEIKIPDTNTDYIGASGQCPSTGNLPRDLLCGPLRVLTFYIDQVKDTVGPGSPEHPALMMAERIEAFDNAMGVVGEATDSAIADNIENLQLQVCKVENSTTCDDEGAWTDWGGADNTATGVLSLRQVRVTVWARPDKRNAEGARKGASPNPLTGLPDGYTRQSETTTILIRNLRMLKEYTN